MSEGRLAEQLTRSVAWPDFGPTGEMGREWRVVAGLAQARIVKLVAEALVGHSLFNLDSCGRIEFLFGPEPVISEDFQRMVRQSLSMDPPGRAEVGSEAQDGCGQGRRGSMGCGDAEAEVLDSL